MYRQARCWCIILGGKGSIKPRWDDYNPATEEFVAFDHLHLLNQPLEPLDFNWIGSYVDPYLLGNNPFNSVRQFILFATTIQGKNITTTYGHIYDAMKFNSWYSKNYDYTRFKNFYTDKSIMLLFTSGKHYYEAIKAFKKLLRNSGVNYDAIK